MIDDVVAVLIGFLAARPNERAEQDKEEAD
jgi:hypothetical protein